MLSARKILEKNLGENEAVTSRRYFDGYISQARITA